MRGMYPIRYDTRSVLSHSGKRVVWSDDMTIVYSHFLTEERLGASDEGTTIRIGGIIVDSCLWMDEIEIRLEMKKESLVKG